jgi:hypothetical protein
VNVGNAAKLFTFAEPLRFVGAVTYGAAVIGRRTAHSFVAEFEQRVLEGKKERLTVEQYSRELSEFFRRRWEDTMPPDYNGPNMTFIVGGYDPDAAYGKVFLFEIPRRPEPEPRNPGDNEFGMTWGGQLELVSRLVQGFDPALIGILRQTLNLDDQQSNQAIQALRQNLGFPIPYQVLPLQDCVDLATFLIRTTMTAQRLAIGVRGVGGPIDVAVITRTEGLRYVQQKTIHGEAG